MTERNETKFRYVTIPRGIFYSKELTATEKLLWGRIHTLELGKHDACTASNEWLSKELSVTPRWISESISNMVKLGVLVSELDEDPKRGSSRKIWTKFYVEQKFAGGRSLRDTSPTPKVPQSLPPKVPPSITAELYSERKDNGAEEKSLQTERETLSDSPPKAGTEAWNHFVRPTGMSDSDYLTLCQSLTQNPATMVEQVTQILAKNAKTNPHTFGYENQKTIASRCRKAVLHKAILTGEVGLAELKTKRKTKKVSK